MALAAYLLLKMPETGRNRRICPLRPPGTGNRLPISGTGSQSWKEKFFLNLTYVADQLAAIKGVDRETVEKMTWIMPEALPFIDADPPVTGGWKRNDIKIIETERRQKQVKS